MKPADNLSQNDALLQKITQVVLNNLDNEQFSVEELSEQIGMSRSQLHRRLKSLKGKSVSQFIREVRLAKAMELLRKDVATTSEIAYRVGFSSPSYFNKCFHNRYGYPPGQVKIKSVDEEQNLQDKTPAVSRKTLTSYSFRTSLYTQKAGWIVGISLLAILLVGYYFSPGKQTHTSIAVLPLHNFTGDPEQEYFVKGWHDALIGALGQISSLRVISRTSTLRYQKDNMATLQEIARELGVDVVVEGSVLGSGDQIRIQLQLIEAFPDERHLWAKEYHQDFRNILVLQSEVVRNIAREIHVTLTPQEETLLAKTPTINPDAYKAYLKGMFHWDKLTEDDLNTAMQYFELAIEIDPDYALSYAGVSLVWVGRLQQGLIPYAEGGPKLKSAALKALELDSTLSEVHYMLGASYCWVDWRYQKSEIAFRKAIALNPNYSKARAYLSHVLNILHQPEEAMEQIEMALKLDPFNPLYQALYGMDLMYARQFDRAIDLLGNTLKTAPTDPVALSTLRTAYHMKGRYPEALEIWKTSYAAKEDHQAIEALQRGERQGGYQDALENLAELLIARSDTTYVTPWQIGTLYTRANRKEEALTWLEKAYDAHDSNMPYIGVDPIFDILRDEPRFQRLLEKMNLPLEEYPLANL